MTQNFNMDKAIERAEKEQQIVNSDTISRKEKKVILTENQKVTTTTETDLSKKAIEKFVYGDNSFSERVEQIKNPVEKHIIKKSLSNNLRAKSKDISLEELEQEILN